MSTKIYKIAKQITNKYLEKIAGFDEKDWFYDNTVGIVEAEKISEIVKFAKLINKNISTALDKIIKGIKNKDLDLINSAYIDIQKAIDYLYDVDSSRVTTADALNSRLESMVKNLEALDYLDLEDWEFNKIILQVIELRDQFLDEVKQLAAMDNYYT